ncbi:MAG TPA: response regulator [Bryobacteraceae bacterium]
MALIGGGPDLLLSDLGLPGMSGIEVVGRVRELLPAVPMLILTIHGKDTTCLTLCVQVLAASC